MRSLPSLTALRVFEVVGKQLSFTQAAKQLHVTQGAVSRQIKQLEDYLGVPLLLRLHHKLELTDAGKQLLMKLELSFNLMESAVVELRDPNLRQKLNILAPPTLATRWLAKRVGTFRRQFPEFEVSIHDVPSDKVLFDCEIRFGRHPRARYSSELMFLEQHTAVCIVELSQQGQALETQNHNLLHNIFEGRKLPVWKDWLIAAGLDQCVDAQRGVEFSTLDQVINALKAGDGFAIIDRHMIDQELKDHTLVQFSDVTVEGPYGYWLDIPLEKQGLSKVMHFSNWIREQL